VTPITSIGTLQTAAGNVDSQFLRAIIDGVSFVIALANNRLVVKNQRQI
jgi:hypothetical protein